MFAAKVRGKNMVGILANVGAVVLGGLFGTVFKRYLDPAVTGKLEIVFGICAMGMGIRSIVLLENLPPVIAAVVFGTLIGLVFRVGRHIASGAALLQKPIAKLTGMHGAADEAASALLVTAVVLFCFSGTGIYGCLDAGMTGNPSILLSKAILDLFASMIFACTLGAVVSVIAVPQLCIFLALFAAAKLVLPFTTPAMVADFKACGGFLLIATGFRLSKIQDFPLADMLPAMVLVMPLSALWSNCLAPLLF